MADTVLLTLLTTMLVMLEGSMSPSPMQTIVAIMAMRRLIPALCLPATILLHTGPKRDINTTRLVQAILWHPLCPPIIPIRRHIQLHQRHLWHRRTVALRAVSLLTMSDRVT